MSARAVPRADGALAIPFLIGTMLVLALPAVAGLALALTDANGLATPEWIGLRGVASVLADGRLHRALVASLTFVAVSVPVRLLLVVGLATLLARRDAVAGAGRLAALTPTALPDVAFGLAWLWLLNPLDGPGAALARSFGVERLSLLTDPVAARIVVPLVAAFQLGEGLVVALAFRRALPPRLHEAAAIEGASPLRTLRTVTLPLLAPVLLLLAVRDAVVGLSPSFGPALVLTEGGPGDATTYLPTFAYRTAFRYLRLGSAATIGGVQLVLSLVIVGAAIVLAHRRGWLRS